MNGYNFVYTLKRWRWLAVLAVFGILAIFIGCDTDPTVLIPVNPSVEDFDIAGLEEQTYNGEPKAVTITPKPGKSGGAITVYYTGVAPTEYSRSTTPPSDVGSYQVTFSVEASTNFNAASGLTAGTLTIVAAAPAPANECDCTETEHDEACDCNGDDCACTVKQTPPVSCTCPEGTTHEPNEICCEGIDCDCSIAEPAVTEFPLTGLLDNDSTATIIDGRVAAGSATLEDLGLVAKIVDAIEAGFNSGNNPTKNRYRTVFNTSPIITVENSSEYSSYKVPVNMGVDMPLYFHVDYLLTVSDEDLITAMNAIVTAANNGTLLMVKLSPSGKSESGA